MEKIKEQIPNWEKKAKLEYDDFFNNLYEQLKEQRDYISNYNFCIPSYMRSMF